MANNHSIEVLVKFQGGEASRNVIDMYDGSAALFGLAKTFLISSHFLVNERVTFHAPAAKGVRCYMRTSRPGSWEQVVQIALDHKEFALGVAGAVSKDILKDFTKVVLTHGIGRPVKAATKYVRDLLQRRDADFDALREATEGPLREAHRTIRSRSNRVRLATTGGERIASFDDDSRRYVTDVIVDERRHDVVGAISSYNVNSKRGRIYDADLRRTVPFELAEDVSRRARLAITWSLDQRNNGLPGEVIATVGRELRFNNEVKRYRLHDVRPR